MRKIDKLTEDTQYINDFDSNILLIRAEGEKVRRAGLFARVYRVPKEKEAKNGTIDTNIFLSALLTKNNDSATVKIYEAIADCIEIIFPEKHYLLWGRKLC